MHQIIETEFKGGLRGDALFLNVQQIRKEFKYLGIWYARDGNEATFITTEIYGRSGEPAEKPRDYLEEIKENSFKQIKRIELTMKHDWLWIATRIDGDTYCKLKADNMMSGHTYINYRTIRNKSTGFDLLDKGVFKGGTADFFRLGSEDLRSKEDYSDAIMYVIMARDIPPADWMSDRSCLGVQNVPVLVPQCTFTTDRKYSDWAGQNPMANVKS